MEKIIIVINGTGGSGKDTFVNFAANYAKVSNFSSIAKVKEIANHTGWTGDKTEKDRKFLSDLKRMTTEYNDMAFKDTKRAVKEFRESDSEVLFIHIREPEEIARAVTQFGALTLLIKRENLENITSNYSDANVENYSYDFEIVNTDSKQLELEAKTFITSLNDFEIQSRKSKENRKPFVSSQNNEIAEILKRYPLLFLKLQELEEKQQRVKKLRNDNGPLNKPVVITINGTPRAGKTTCIENLYDFLKKTGFKTVCLEEPAGLVYKTLKTSEEKINLLRDRVGFVDQQFTIGTNSINDNKDSNEMLLCDRGAADTFVWYQWYYQKGLMSDERYEKFLKRAISPEEYYNFLYMLYAKPEVSLERDVLNSLSLAPRTTMNKAGITEYNQALKEMRNILCDYAESAVLIDTSNLERMDAGIIIANDILDKVQRLYLGRN